MNHEIYIDEQKCVGCKQCIKDCPQQNIDFINNCAHIRSQDCLKCGHCVAICPKEAVSMTGFDHEPVLFDYNKKIDPHSFLELIQKSRSIRQFQNKEIPQDVLNDIIETAQYMPTAKNMRDVEVILLKKEQANIEKVAVGVFKRLLKIMNVFNKKYRGFEIDEHFFFKQAPLVILVVAKNQTNADLAASAMAFMAQVHGLGVLYSGFFTMVSHISLQIKKMLAIQKGKKVYATLVIGYPAVKYMRGVQRDPVHVEYR